MLSSHAYKNKQNKFQKILAMILLNNTNCLDKNRIKNNNFATNLHPEEYLSERGPAHVQEAHLFGEYPREAETAVAGHVAVDCEVITQAVLRAPDCLWRHLHHESRR